MYEFSLDCVLGFLLFSIVCPYSPKLFLGMYVGSFGMLCTSFVFTLSNLQSPTGHENKRKRKKKEEKERKQYQTSYSRNIFCIASIWISERGSARVMSFLPNDSMISSMDSWPASSSSSGISRSNFRAVCTSQSPLRRWSNLPAL